MKCMFEKPECEGEKLSKWYNSKGELFRVCPKHLNLLQMVVDDYEETAPDEFKVVKEPVDKIGK